MVDTPQEPNRLTMDISRSPSMKSPLEALGRAIHESRHLRQAAAKDIPGDADAFSHDAFRPYA
jgi:hypothetical protein